MRTIQATILADIPELADTANGDDAAPFFDGMKLVGSDAKVHAVKLVPVAPGVLRATEVAGLKAALVAAAGVAGMDPVALAALSDAVDRVTPGK